MTTTTTIIPIDKEQALTVPERARSIAITSNDDYLNGETFLAVCKQLEQKIHDDLDEPVKKAHTAWKSMVALRDKYLLPLEEGRRILKSKMIAYQDAQERIRKAEQAKAEEEARKQAEEEALELAQIADLAGDSELADQILEQPIIAPAVIIPKATPNATRLSAGRSFWFVEVVNKMDLVKAVAEGKQPITLLEPNMTALNGLARSLKNTLNIPGVQARERRG